MKVGFFTPHIKWPSHYETELELIQEHLNAGDEVIQFVCNSDLPTCDINPKHNINTCLSCIGCRDFGKKLIKGNYVQKSILMLSDEDRAAIKEISEMEFSDVDALKKLRIDNFDIGYAVASSIISQVRDPKPDLVKHKRLVKSYIVSSAGVYKSMLQFLKNAAIDRVYTFNGRFAHVKPVLRACQAMQVDCYIHERGSSKDYYALYKNTTPHDIKYVEQAIRQRWADADSDERAEKGKEFYYNRINGVEKGWFSFTKQQVKGQLPKEWDPLKKNIIIFNSSEDEFASIGEEWANPVYKTQLEGLRKIIKDLNDIPGVHVYLRVHPNLKKVNNADKDELYRLKGKNFTLIPAESPISTYDLLKVATKVVTFGSTLGIEAVYWGKPSVLVGKSYYCDLGGTYNANSHKQVIDLLIDDLKPKDIEPALMYGYYMSTFGIPFKYYKADSFDKGTYNGHFVQDIGHVKFRALDWILWKPGVRIVRPHLDVLHSTYLTKAKYT
jgi:hypothetical protein